MHRGGSFFGRVVGPAPRLFSRADYLMLSKGDILDDENVFMKITALFQYVNNMVFFSCFPIFL